MNHDDNNLGDELRWALRGLRRDTLPERDLWPQIAARLAAPATPAAPATAKAWLAPWALAASLLLALGVAWRLQAPEPAPGPQAQLLDREAQALTREYDAALHELQASAPQTDAGPAVRELDRSAAQIRSALQRDPDARFLLERLRHTYSLRLALTQRAALS